MSIFEETQKQQDLEANIFAAYLLIPANLLKKELDKMGGIDLTDDTKFDKLCKKFGVTHSCMAFRFSLTNDKKL